MASSVLYHSFMTMNSKNLAVSEKFVIKEIIRVVVDPWLRVIDGIRNEVIEWASESSRVLS